MLLNINSTKFENVCVYCGLHSTYIFNHGSTRGKDGPYNLADPQNLGLSVTFRFDDDYGGEGTIETVAFSQDDFPDMSAVTTDQLVTKFNSVLLAATALNDYGGILIVSKTSGATSCVEAIDGYARKRLGFMLYDADGLHTCCGRPCAGFVNDINPNEAPQHRAIMLRRCWCGNQEMLLSSQISYPDRQDHTDYNHSHRMGVTSLVKYLVEINHMDSSSETFYASKDRFEGADLHPVFEETGEVVLITYEEFTAMQPGGKYPKYHDDLNR